MKSIFPAFAVLFFAATIMMSGLSSCGNQEQSDDTQTQDTVAVETPVVEDGDSSEVLLPSPLQIATLFKKSGLTYLDGVANETSNASKYSSMNKRALNAGVYTTDLAYCVLNKQTQKAMDYVKTVRTLGAQMGMGSVFDNNAFVSRFEKHINNEDSLIEVVADLQMETDMYLENNDMQKISPVMFAGAWLEAVYIGAKVNEKKKNENLNHKITEQMIILDKIIAALSRYSKDDQELQGFVSSLKEISVYYNSIPSIQKYKETESEAEAKLSDEELKELTNRIIQLRNSVVNG